MNKPWRGVRRDGVRWRVFFGSLPFPRLLFSATWRGVVYSIVQPWQNAGLRWKIGEDTSSGAFYDGVSEHPEGALEWAKAGARKAIDKDAGSRWPPKLQRKRACKPWRGVRRDGQREALRVRAAAVVQALNGFARFEVVRCGTAFTTYEEHGPRACEWIRKMCAAWLRDNRDMPRSCPW